MPIRPELRHHYGAAWREIRAAILERSRPDADPETPPQCEQCGKGQREAVITLWDGTGRWMAATQPAGLPRVWLDRTGHVAADQGYRLRHENRSQVVLTVAHLNHDPADNRPENLRALCQGCHLWHDRQQHAENGRATKREKRRRRQPELPIGEDE